MKKEYTVQNISIHTLRGEGDELDGAIVSITMDFNPHPPWGGRQLVFPVIQKRIISISIHTLRGEGDG